PISLLVMGLEFAGLSLSHSIPIILISVSLVGFGQVVIFPLINVRALNQVNPIHTDKVIAIVSSMIYIGQFLSPVVLDAISRIAGQPTIRFQYGVIAVCMIITFGVALIIKQIKPKTEIQKAA